MKFKFWPRLNYFLGLVSVLILFCLIIIHTNNEVKDLDLWLHLKSGEYIVQNRVVPDRDIFSFSIAGRQWINHEWLFQVIAYLSYHQWQEEGLISLQTMVVVATFLILLFLGYKRTNLLKIVFGLLLVLFVYRMRFTIRPDIFSLLFFSVYLYLLTKHLNKKIIIYVLPLLQILWVNSHGFFSLGIIILFLYILAEFIKRQFRLPWQWNQSKLSDVDYKRLKILFLLVFLASFANPCTFRGVVYPFNVIGQLAGESRIFFRHIQELRQSITLRNIFDFQDLAQYKLLILLSALCFFLNRRKLNISHLMLWLLFLPMSIIAIRNIVFFSFVAYMVVIVSLEQIEFSKILPLNFREDKFKHISKFLLGAILIVWMIDLGNELLPRGYFVFDNYEMKSIYSGTSQRSYPAKAIDFILDNKISGRIFNDFNSGAYLIGKCFPKIRVFIDGRTELYGPVFFNNYRKMLDEDTLPFEQTVEKDNVNIALLSSVYHPIPGKILRYLYRSPHWRLVFFDEYAVIFLKNVPENKQLIDKYRISLDKWKPYQVDLLRMGPKRFFPYINIYRAVTLNSLELDNSVLREASEALKIMPECAEAYSLIGKVYMRQNSWKKAFENFRLAASYLSSNAEIRTNLGTAYLKLNDKNSAVKQFNLAIKVKPDYTEPYYQLALIHIEKKNYKQAIELLRKAVKINPKDIQYQEALADSLVSENKFKEASDVFRKALEIDATKMEIRNKLAKSYLSLGLIKDAQKEYNKVLETDPQNKEAQKQIKEIKRQELEAH